jgi:hypothetical protein
LLIAKFPQLTSHTSNTVDKLNKSKLSGLVNNFTMVLQLLGWWCCCCCLFLCQWKTVRWSTVPVAAVVALAAAVTAAATVTAATAVTAAAAAVDDEEGIQWQQWGGRSMAAAAFNGNGNKLWIVIGNGIGRKVSQLKWRDSLKASCWSKQQRSVSPDLIATQRVMALKSKYVNAAYYTEFLT